MSVIRKSGGYRSLASFQTATMIYDATVWFCERFLDRRSRTIDQMVQAARSGRQNIAEGSRAAKASSQTELRLVNVARASLEELLLDYEDFLRQRRLPQWSVDSPQAAKVRGVPQQFKASAPADSDRPGLIELNDQQRWELYSQWLDSDDAADRANALICLIHQANFLLDRQIAELEQQFITEGGYSEQLAAARMTQRARRRDQEKAGGQSIPDCPTCGGMMSLRTAKQGKNAGQQFWGCNAYPDCRGIVSV